MLRLALEFTPAARTACLRGLCGADEEAVEGGGTAAAIALLDRLLVDAPGVEPDLALKPGRALDLAAPDRDRLLAAVYRETFGPRVESTLVCDRCGADFDMN